MAYNEVIPSYSWSYGERNFKWFVLFDGKWWYEKFFGDASNGFWIKVTGWLDDGWVVMFLGNPTFWPREMGHRKRQSHSSTPSTNYWPRLLKHDPSILENDYLDLREVNQYILGLVLLAVASTQVNGAQNHLKSEEGAPTLLPKKEESSSTSCLPYEKWSL